MHAFDAFLARGRHRPTRKPAGTCRGRPWPRRRGEHVGAAAGWL